jgi:hypothetical protein
VPAFPRILNNKEFYDASVQDNVLSSACSSNSFRQSSATTPVRRCNCFEAIAHESPARQQEELGDLLFVIINRLLAKVKKS